MNRRQWQVLALGTVAALLIPALSVSRPSPLASIGPIVETAPGHYSQEITMARLPKWPLYVSLCLAGLTVAVVYRCRTKDTQ